MTTRQAVQVLLGCKRVDPNIKNRDGQTARQIAEKKNDPRIVELFTMANDESTCKHFLFWMSDKENRKSQGGESDKEGVVRGIWGWQGAKEVISSKYLHF
jgi:hypothetical protein